MKRTFVSALVGMAIGCAQGADNAPVAPRVISAGAGSASGAAITLDALLSLPADASMGVNNLRAKMVSDAGHTVGFRGGMASRSHALMQSLDARKPELDALFQFSTLVRSDGTIPPVIVEAVDVASFAPDQFRKAGHVYRIEKEERFVSVPPTWRNYLLAGLSAKESIELPIPEARPQDAKEMLIWREAVRSGWEEGVKQADAVLDANFSRLSRDYTGMILYSPLLAKGMILPTRVAELSQPVTGDGQQMMLNDTLRRLTTKARFETGADKWTPDVSTGQRTASKPGDAGGAAGQRGKR
jgi:defect-in-organelle-trafficking protein DotC